MTKKRAADSENTRPLPLLKTELACRQVLDADAAKDLERLASLLRKPLIEHGRAAGELKVDVLHETMRMQQVLEHALEAWGEKHDVEINANQRFFISHGVQKCVTEGYETADNIVRKRANDAEANYFDGLEDKYEQQIWEATKKGEDRLIEPMVAYAVQQELPVRALERDGGKPRFYAYSETKRHWAPTSDLVVQKYARYVIGNRSSLVNANKLRSIATIVAQDVLVDQDDISDESESINLANGTLDLETFELREHDTNDFYTYCNPYIYDEKAKCPLFMEQLELYSQYDPTWIQAFWEIAGAILSNKNPYQKMFWWLGSGANGKGTCLRLLTQLVGDKLSVSGFSWKKLTGNFYLTALEGRRLAVCGDADKELKNADDLKQLSGGDRMSTDVKYGTQRDVEVTAKLIIALNRMPRVETGEQLFPLERRIHLMPFDYSIPMEKVDPNMDIRLQRELPGILNHALEGLRRLRANNNVFTRVAKGEKRVKAWLSTLNMFQTFISERLIVTKSRADGDYAIRLWQEYDRYMEKNAEPNWKQNPRYITNAKAFTNRLREDLGLESTETYANEAGFRGTYTWLFGVRLVTERDEYAREQQARESYRAMMKEVGLESKVEPEQQELMDVPF